MDWLSVRNLFTSGYQAGDKIKFELGLDSFLIVLVVLIAISVVTGAIAIYCKTRAVVGRRLAGFLLALRLLQLLLLFVIVLEPRAYFSGEQEIKNRLMVLVDQSASMGERDVTATPEALKNAAEALQWGGQTGSVSQSAVERLKHMSRLDVIRESLATDQARFWKTLQKKRDIKVAGFATQLIPMDISPTNQWETAFTNAPGEATFMGTVLHEVISRQRGTLSEILLFSDGAANGGMDPLAAAQEAQGAGIRIFPVVIGAPPVNPDTLLLSAAANMLANVGDDVEVVVEIYNRGYGGRTTEVELRQGEAVMDHQPLTLQAETHQRIALKYKADKIGIFGLTAAVKPQDGEKNLANNIHHVTIQVTDDRYRIWIAEGYPRWEYRFLKNLGHRDRGLDTSVVLQSDPENAAAFPDDPAAWTNSDVIVLGDISPHFVSDRQLKILDDFVAKRGGGLVIIAGEDYMPAAFRASPLEPLLPVVLPPLERRSYVAADNAAPFKLVLTPEGDALAAMRLEDDPLANAQAWSRLPGYFWARTAERLKPGATALAVQTTGSGDGRMPVITLQPYGKGRVLYLAFDSTWRWRYLWGETQFDRFWGQMLRNMAPERKNRKKVSRIETSKPAYLAAETIGIEATIYRRDDKPATDEHLTLRVTGVATNLVLDLVRSGDHYRASWPHATDGNYLLVFDRDGYVPTACRVRVGPLRTELDDTTPDRPLLKQMADASGGTLFEINNYKALAEVLPARSRTVEHHTRDSLWDNWPVFLLIALANLVELLFRKRWGLL